ncbi:F-box only protein 33-like protein [Leptotrombidium deliense]|uniref:F-box only protein 33-like protein n=1 Tax=Leptotrombidium deliense TaxID=299467 RepID=A0A443SCF5_9ACAR|nr:F-box only protein 33-like protein [Leptotrombidium deliense]
MSSTFLWNNIPSVVLFNVYSNLSPNERILASSTCKAWREALYHSSVWPSNRLTLNLTKKTNAKKSDSKRNKTASYQQFLQKCYRFLQNVEIIFELHSSSQFNELLNIIRIMYDSAMDHKSLTSFSLKPIHVQVSANRSANDVMLLENAMKRFIGRHCNLKHLSLGCLEQMLNCTPSLLSIMAQRNNTSLQSLHLLTVKEDPDYYPVPDIPAHLFEPFVNLKVLSIDYDFMSDDLLSILAVKPLEKLIINVHGLDDEHPGVSKSAWSKLKWKQKLEVTLNLLHTDDSPDGLREMILETDIPLSHFRAFFLGYNTGIAELIKVVAIKHQNTLRSLVLLNSLAESTFFPNTCFSRATENELVMLAWRCKKLQHLTVIGYEISEVDLIAITRLRGYQLKELLIPSCCILLSQSPIIEDEGYYDDDRFYLDMADVRFRNQVISDIAKPLNRDWIPMTFDEIPKSVYDPHHSPDSAYLPTLHRDTSC